ncbi:MAG TPA: hypothetical protein VLB80_03685 [Candidatus Babeliales bacterium]|nr:hypothetical protein [Candidatus Babeliales bacterium]
MFFITMIVFFLFSGAIPIFSSQIADNSINISVQLNEPISLMYMLKNEDNLKKFNINTSNNIPYVNVKEYKTKSNQDNIATTKDITNVYNDLRANLLCIPFNCFLNNKNFNKFRNKDEVLFSFKRIINSTEHIFNIIFDNDLSKNSPQIAINSFYEHPGNRLIDEEKLIELGILAKDNDGKIIHGENGYFNTKPIQIKIYINRPRLLYIDEATIKQYKNIGISINHNDPCFLIHPNNYEIEKPNEGQIIINKIKSLMKNFILKIGAVPLRFLIKCKGEKDVPFTLENLNHFEFKKQDEALVKFTLTYKNMQIKCEINLYNHKDLTEKTLTDYINNFRDSPPDYIVLNTSNAQNNNRKELIKKKIISIDGKSHGEKSFFGTEIKETEQCTEIKTEIKKTGQRAESALFFSRLKIVSFCCLCGLIALITFLKNSKNLSSILQFQIL